MKKIWLFFWWLSNEYEVSLYSAKNIIKNIDTWLYELILLYWSKEWFFYKINDISEIDIVKEDQKIFIEEIKNLIDVALLMTHGKFWEDWFIQWLLESQKISYCWCRVLSSALCMDKWLFKELMKWHWIKQVKFLTIDFSILKWQEYKNKLEEIKKTFSLPLYIKPANSWSSVGITKVTNFNNIDQAIITAKQHDNKIIIEEWLINPKEIEIAILWNDEIIVSNPWELILSKDFYDYEDKYKNNEAKVQIPANISQIEKVKITELANKIYRLCDCRGFARIDFFLSWWEIYINEINTLPGFTDISMFPMLMKNTGISYTELINRIISLAY